MIVCPFFERDHYTIIVGVWFCQFTPLAIFDGGYGGGSKAWMGGKFLLAESDLQGYDPKMTPLSRIFSDMIPGKDTMEIKLDKERIKVLREKAQIYFRDELDESIGDLKADLIVEFFIKQIGPQIYNQAINDAYAFIQDKLIDLEGALYVPE